MKHNLSEKSSVKSASNRHATIVISIGSTPKSVGMQEKGHKHRPFHLASDFPYQWKDLSTDKSDKRDHKEEAANTSVNVTKVSSPIKNQFVPTKTPIKTTSIQKKGEGQKEKHNSFLVEGLPSFKPGSIKLFQVIKET